MFQLVVSCTERKSLAAPAELSVRALPRSSFADRLTAWLEVAGLAPREIPALNLYRGEHWSVARRLFDEGEVDLWVASAGFGLVHATDRLSPYSATFAARHADSIVLQGGSSNSVENQLSAWWSALQADRAIPTAALSDVVKRGPIVIAASRSYLLAMCKEIAAAALEGQIVIASTSRPPLAVAELCPPATGRLRQLLGGSMQALNVRLAAAIVSNFEEGDLNPDSVRAFVEALVARAPEAQRFDRQVLSDDEVIAFIRAQAAIGARPAWSTMLRTLRENGMACEQHRFRKLFAASAVNS